MRKFEIKEIGGLGKGKYTESEYDNEVTTEQLAHHLEKVANILVNHPNYICYVVGMGAQPKSKYLELRKVTGVDVMWYQSILPKYLRILSYAIASYAGLIKVNKPERLKETFLKLSEQSMVGVYLFNPSREESFVQSVKDNPLPNNYDFTVKEDDDYFMYIVDADNAESSTGIYEIVSYGVAASDMVGQF